MCQVLFWIPLHFISSKLGDIPVYGFGAMLFLAFVSCVFLAGRMAQRDGVPADRIEKMAIWLFLFGIIGARTTFIIVTPGPPGESLLQMFGRFFRIWDGGLVYYGSFIGGVIGFFVASRGIARDYHVSRWKIADFLAPSLALGLCLGRIGCLLNGCCYGNVACEHCPSVSFPLSAPPRFDFVHRGLQTAAGFTLAQPGSPTVGAVEPDSEAYRAGLRPGDVLLTVNGKEIDSSIALRDAFENWERGRSDLSLVVRHANGAEERLPPIYAETLPLHPTQVYESISMGLLLFVLLAYYRIKTRDGTVLILFMYAYALHRFLNEMLRTDTEKVAFNMTLSQNLSLLMAAAATVLLVLVYTRKPPQPVAEGPAPATQLTGERGA